MALGSLEDTVGKLQPRYTKDVILVARNTPDKVSRVWIVVEGDDDIEIYEKFFNPDRTKVLPSEISKRQKGCVYLEQIVTEVLTVDATILIFGIRDTDYTRYENPPHIFPKSVFGTDYRDIETTMLAAESVLSELNAWNSRFLDTLKQCLPVARHMGYMRICNYLGKLGCNFKKKVKVASVWDENKKAFVPNWEECLLQLFLENCPESFSQQDFNTLRCKFAQEDDLYICQGHDLLRLLQYAMIPNDRIKGRMIAAYSSEDFYQTCLYFQISKWATEHNVDDIWG